jgi:hypothetical protein
MPKSPTRKVTPLRPASRRGVLPGRQEEGIPNTMRLRQLREDVERISARARERAQEVRTKSDDEMFGDDPDRALRLGGAFIATRDEFELTIDHFSLDKDEGIEVLRKVLAHFDAKRRPKEARSNARPETAPEHWDERDRNVSENPVQFTRRIYGRWLGKGLTRRDLRNLDPHLYRALSVWMHRHPEDDMPELPPLSAVLDDLIERLSSELSLDELRKLGYAIDTRLRRANKS